MTASLSVNSPFNRTLKYESKLEDPTFRRTSTSYYTLRQIRLNLSYSFGQMKGEIKKARRTIQNEDLKKGNDTNVSGNTGS